MNVKGNKMGRKKRQENSKQHNERKKSFKDDERKNE